MEKKRITYLDMVKGIGIILVVIGHSTYASDSLLTWLASFHMPLFFIVSGMLIWQIGEEKKSFLEILQRKAKSIMIPYVTFSVIFMIVKLLYLVRMPELITMDQIGDAIYQSVTLYGISVLWFLPALFVSELLFLGIRKVKKGTEFVTIVTAVVLAIVAVMLKPVIDRTLFASGSKALLGIYYFSSMLLRSFAAFAFLTMGYYVKRFIIKDTQQKKLGEAAIGIVLFVLVIYLSAVNGRVDMNFLVFGQPVLFYLTAFLGTMAIVLICKNIITIRPLVFLGVNSLIIMATHLECQILMLAIRFSMWMNQYVTHGKQYVFYLCLAAWIILMEVITIYIFNHYFYFLIGKKKPQSKKLKMTGGNIQ